VLIADDNVDAASSLAILLQSVGHAVEIAHDGLAAVELAGRFHPEVAILDIGMPHMDGYETARRIRGITALQDCLLVALTGWGQDDDKRRARAAGFDAHLTKPVDPEEFLMVVAKLRNDRGRQLS
jgi:CheY-like chemotaxis protein